MQDAYCQREQLDLSKLCFLYKGRRIIPDETPEELDMEQVVTVDVVKLYVISTLSLSLPLPLPIFIFALRSENTRRLSIDATE